MNLITKKLPRGNNQKPVQTWIQPLKAKEFPHNPQWWNEILISQLLFNHETLHHVAHHHEALHHGTIHHGDRLSCLSTSDWISDKRETGPELNPDQSRSFGHQESSWNWTVKNSEKSRRKQPSSLIRFSFFMYISSSNEEMLAHFC